MNEEEEYRRLLELGGNIGTADADIERQKLLAKRMRGGIVDLSQPQMAGRVAVRPNILQGIGNAMREYGAGAADEAQIAGAKTKNVAQQEQNQRVLAMILRKQAAAQAAGPTTGTRPVRDEDPYSPFMAGGNA